jgi:hypothetical protein
MSNHKVFESINVNVNVKNWVLIVWPAFVTACLLEALVFSVVDPSELHWSGFMLQPSRQGVYTIAFFCFWLISMVCSGLACWLASPNRNTKDADLD